MAKKLKITLVRSAIDRMENQKRTVKALGLKKLHRTVIHDDNPVIRGMVRTVIHLVEVEVVDGE
jgi:large subunit ribosomal protein L30